MTQRDDDLAMLKTLLDNHIGDGLTEGEVEAFADMRFNLHAYANLPAQHRFAHLTEKQRAWLTSVHERIVLQYANLVSRGLAPRGKEVLTPSALQNLPKRPLQRRRDED